MTSANADTSPPSAAHDALGALARLPWLAGMAIAFALLLLRQPYRGVRHDATLYVGQALAKLAPDWAVYDFILGHDAQGQFSIFGGAIAASIDRFGIAPSQIGLLLACQALCLVAAWLLTAGWPASRRWLAVLAMAGIAHFYGAQRIFQVMEPFATARTLAEPLALLALAALLRGRLAWAAVALAGATACHPLIALPAALVGWVFLILRDRRWAWLALGALPVIALAVAGIEPFARLLQRYDETWFAVTVYSSSDVFVSEWAQRDFTLALANAVFLWLAIRGRDEPLARLSRASLLATLVLCLASFVGADLVHDVLLTQLQLWRVMWVTHVLFILWLPTLVLTSWQRGPAGRVAAVALLFVPPALAHGFTNGWGLALWTLAWLEASRRDVALSPAVVKLAMFATAAMGVGVTAYIGYELAAQLRMHGQGTSIQSIASLPFSLGALTLPTFAALLWGIARYGRAPLACLLAALLLATALWQFDQRTPFARVVEARRETPHPFAARIPPQAQVWWEDNELAPVWLLLRRPSFAGSGQFAGLLFDRQAAMTATGRLPLIVPIVARNDMCGFLESSVHGNYQFEDCRTPEPVFFGLCNPGQPVHADFLVTHQTYGRPPDMTWRFDPRDGSPPLTYSLYDCKGLR